MSPNRFHPHAMHLLAQVNIRLRNALATAWSRVTLRRSERGGVGTSRSFAEPFAIGKDDLTTERDELAGITVVGTRTYLDEQPPEPVNRLALIR